MSVKSFVFFNRSLEIKNRAKSFDNPSLSELGIFWAAIVVPLFISAILFIVICLNSNLFWDFSYKGFNFFIKTFRFPIAVAALIFPCVALVAANHRSIQTKKQIETIGSQNMFSNYYKHVEEFYKLIDRLSENYGLKVESKPSLYLVFFAKNSPTFFSPYYNVASNNINLTSAHELIEKKVNEINGIHEDLSLDNGKKDEYLIIKLREFFDVLATACLLTGFEIELKDEEYVYVRPDPLINGTKIYYSNEDPFKHLRLFTRYINEIRFFCHINPVGYKLNVTDNATEVIVFELSKKFRKPLF